MVNNSILYKKITYIKFNIDRLKSKQYISQKEFLNNFDIRESVLLNLQQAIQGCIYISTHIIADNSWGTPGSTSDIFYILEKHKIIPSSMVEIMVKMCGFRNLIVHQYSDINYNIVYTIYQNQLIDFDEFLNEIQHHFNP